MSNSNSNLPPEVSTGVFSVSASSEIDASPEKVWSIILDFPKYKDWNPFVRGQTITDKHKKPVEDQTPGEGKYLMIAPVHLPPTMDAPTEWFQVQSAFEVISTVDHENRRVAWVNIDMPRFLLKAERWQAVSVNPTSGKTKYETTEVFGGILSYFVKFFFQDKLRRGFRAQAEGLKAYAERSS